ncbi:MAG TPA: hypothetical protein VHI10_08245 [Mycobacterium sp.]|nr:hypothetical protein [Mycobacterium sp.]
MPTLIVRYDIDEDGVDDVVNAVAAAFAAVNEQRPGGIRWTYWRRAGSTEFVALLELDDGVENPLPAIDACRELQAVIAKWVPGEPPTPQPLQLLGSYR